MKLKDKFYLGLLYGTALPLLAYVFGDMIQQELQKFIRPNFFYILCIALNIIIFRIALKKDYEKLARGVLFSTFIYALIFAFFILRK
jgi:hypothetical protein